jgi:hypothetical protein
MSIDRRSLAAMFTASAVSVANIYYCQPLLSEMGHSLGVSDRGQLAASPPDHRSGKDRRAACAATKFC